MIFTRFTLAFANKVFEGRGMLATAPMQADFYY